MRELPETNHEMISRLAERSEGAWLDFVQIYGDALKRFCVSRGLSQDDAADVCQDVLTALDKNLVDGKYDPEKGRFRSWLFGIARNISVDKFYERAKQINATGGSSIQQLVEATPDNDDISEAIEREYRRSLASTAAARIRPTVSEATWRSFWETAVQGRGASEVASELGMSIGSVYTAKCRMISKIREAVASYEDRPASGPVGESLFDIGDCDHEV